MTRKGPTRSGNKARECKGGRFWLASRARGSSQSYLNDDPFIPNKQPNSVPVPNYTYQIRSSLKKTKANVDEYLKQKIPPPTPTHFNSDFKSLLNTQVVALDEKLYM